MADAINARLSRIRDVLNGSLSLNSTYLAARWQEVLEDFLNHPGGAAGAAERWLILSSSDGVPGVIELLMLAIERDRTEISSTCAVHLLHICVDIATDAVPYLDNAAHLISSQMFLKDVSAMSLGIIASWWRKFRHLATKWTEEGDLANKISGFLALFELYARYESLNSEGISSLQEAVTTSVELHDFIMYAGVFLEFCDGFKAALLLAVVSATASRLPSRLLALTTTRQHMQTKPLALSSRFEELLSNTDDVKVYEQLIRGMAWLFKDDLFASFLMQPDLALTLISSHWTFYARQPRGPNKDAITCTTLLLISSLSNDIIRGLQRQKDPQAFVSQLLSEGDLLSLTEQGMILQITTFSGEPPLEWELVGKLLRVNLEALRPPLRRDFLHILDYLKTVPTASGQQLLRWW
ncbi:hypothetical protein FRB98_001254, partial [Tulasnella sp. 332]